MIDIKWENPTSNAVNPWKIRKIPLGIEYFNKKPKFLAPNKDDWIWTWKNKLRKVKETWSIVKEFRERLRGLNKAITNKRREESRLQWGGAHHFFCSQASAFSFFSFLVIRLLLHSLHLLLFGPFFVFKSLRWAFLVSQSRPKFTYHDWSRPNSLFASLFGREMFFFKL